MVTKQNLTLSLDRETIRRAKVLAAQEGTSLSRLLADYIERLLGQEEAYAAARRRALAVLDEGFRLGGEIRSKRDDWHDRPGLR